MIVSGGPPLQNLCHLACVGIDTLVVDDVAQTVYSLGIEIAFPQVQGHFHIVQYIHDDLQMPLMILYGV